MAVLRVQDLVVDFATRQGNARVLDHISLEIDEGEILGIVGESGCGKSMTALSIMGLVPSPPGNITAGSIKLDEREIAGASSEQMRTIRGNEIGMIFQEPMSSLNPVFTVGEQIAESVRLHEGADSRAAFARAVEMLQAVGIPEPEKRARAYPHELSGGMRQRVMIAIALACNPRVLIADEPTTALDTTVQAQIFDLLEELQKNRGTAIVLITHDMGAVAQLADKIAVMYAGRIVETGAVDDVLSNPRHPYTRGLIACVPHLQVKPTKQRHPLLEIPGVVPSLTELGEGCAFSPRCDRMHSKCLQHQPVLETVPDTGDNSHRVACWVTEARADDV